jgi:hypothetical protein
LYFVLPNTKISSSQTLQIPTKLQSSGWGLNYSPASVCQLNSQQIEGISSAGKNG